jgi:hypothetical protein
MIKKDYQDLACELYEQTVDFINEELFEMLYTKNIIENTNDDALDLANKVLYEFFNKQITKDW